MMNETMLELGTKSSVIRELFEYGKQRKQQIGADKVHDFSIGNPSIPAPDKLRDVMCELLNTTDPVALHGYTSAPGDMGVRQTIADSIAKRFGVAARAESVYMTCGAAASLTISLHALVNSGDEVIVLAPFFPEYRVFAEKAGARVVIVPCREPDFQLDIDAFTAAVTAKTKAVIVNSPNNPTGVVLREDTLRQLADVLRAKQQQFNTDIFIIADEPYRELVYGVTVPYLPTLYNNTLVCYSYSKSLSLPGERIGYIFVSPTAKDSGKLFAAVCGAGRALGFVCAPSLLQYTVARCVEDTADISVYEHNRTLLYNTLTNYGYTAVKPDGAFYLFVKALEPNAIAFCERAKKYELLLVPSDSFGYKGYVRISYCVSTAQLLRALPAFAALAEEVHHERA